MGSKDSKVTAVGVSVSWRSSVGVGPGVVASGMVAGEEGSGATGDGGGRLVCGSLIIEVAGGSGDRAPGGGGRRAAGGGSGVHFSRTSVAGLSICSAFEPLEAPTAPH